MPDCYQHVGVAASRLVAASGSAMMVSWWIPYDLGLLGVEIQVQSALLSPVSNAAGVITSNGLQLRLGF
jgi:hypothetical protein